MGSIEAKWVVTIAVVLLWAWRMHALAWFGDRQAANMKMKEKLESSEGPGFFLIILSFSVGSWNVFSLLDHRLSFGPQIDPVTYHIAGQYLIICGVFLVWPFVRGFKADDQVRAISWMVAGAFVVGSVLGPLFTFFTPD